MTSNLLDFSNILTAPGYSAYPVMDSDEKICVLPHRLDIHASAESNNAPVFRLEAIRGITPFSKPEPYGLFEIQLSPAKINYEDLLAIKEKWSEAVLYTPDFSSGYLGLSLIAEDGEHISDELKAPVQLSNLPLSRLRFVRRVSMNYLKLVKESLHKELILLKAYGLFSVKGFAPMIPVSITFNPKDLTTTLIGEMGLIKERISFSSLREFFDKPLSDLPFETELQDEPDQNQLTSCLVDWYINRFCTVRPPSTDDDEVTFALNEDAETSGKFTWNLSEPFVTERFTHFTLDTLEAGRHLLKEKGIDEIFKTNVVEPLPTGFLRIEVFHPFFQIPLGIRQLGIKLSAEPNSPLRTQAIHETVAFNSGQSKKVVSLQFSPGEEPSYRVTPFAIYEDHEGTKEVLGEHTDTREKELVIEQHAFPFRFISFTCSVNILAQASLTLVVKIESEEEALYEPVVLDKNHPSVMFALPKDDSSEFICNIAARDLSTGEVVTTSIPILSDYKIDLTSFREYGSHKVIIQFNVPEGKVVAIDLLPENKEPIPTNITTVAFTKDKREIQWSWFSPSIFRAGFRYRFHGESDEAWSNVQPPFMKELKLENQHQPI